MAKVSLGGLGIDKTKFLKLYALYCEFKNFMLVLRFLFQLVFVIWISK